MNTTGDLLLATFDGPARAVRCAQAIGAAVRPLGLEIRAGCYRGEVEVGDVEDAGERELKGVPDRWHLYRVVGS